jgi:hypothetical protein
VGSSACLLAGATGLDRFWHAVLLMFYLLAIQGNVAYRTVSKTSSSCANWENLLQRRYQHCSKCMLILHRINSQFKNGQMLEDDQCSGRPSTSRTKEIIEKV